MTKAASSNAIVLAIAQGLFTAAIAIDLTLTGLTGFQLAPDKSLATLPFATITVAGALMTLPASALIERLGRRAAFTLGCAICSIGGLISVWAILHASFWLFCVGTAGVGVFQAFAQFYRLAAADSVPPARKPRAISMVLGGGVIAAVLGPMLAAWSKNWLSTLFAGSYLFVAILGAASALLFAVTFRDLRIDGNIDDDPGLTPRSLREVFAQPISRAALAGNVIGGVVMMFIMTAAPLAAVENHHSIDDGATIIQWHLVGMYAPSLFAGRLIERFGMPAVLFAGILLNLGCVAIGAASTSLTAFYIALLCLGIGWNFMFVGGTALLASSYLPHERARVQGASELIRFVATAFATLAAGPVLQAYGWRDLNLMMAPPLAVAACVTWLWVRSEKRAVF